jgi:hypothetical protein
VHALSFFPRSSHRTAVHQVFRYLKHTLEFGIWYSASSSLDLVGFSMLILRVLGLTKKALLGLAIFLDLLSFAGLLRNSLQLHCPPPRPSMQLLLTDSLDSAHHERFWSEV